MKAVVAAFNQEKALVASRGLLRDYEPSDGTFSSTTIYLITHYTQRQDNAIVLFYVFICHFYGASYVSFSLHKRTSMIAV